MKAALALDSRPTAPQGHWLQRLLRWCSDSDAAWLALGQRTHPHDWWAGA